MTDLLGKVHTNLEKMCQRSQDKRNQEIKSIWGKVKWFFLSWFYDNPSKLELIPSSKEKLLEIINPTLRARILSEIKAFEKEINLPQAKRTKADEIQTPTNIKKWLTKYLSDHYEGDHMLSEKSKSLRDNIVALNRFWEDITTQDLSATGEQARQAQEFLEERHYRQSEPINIPPRKEKDTPTEINSVQSKETVGSLAKKVVPLKLSQLNLTQEQKDRLLKQAQHRHRHIIPGLDSDISSKG